LDFIDRFKSIDNVYIALADLNPTIMQKRSGDRHWLDVHLFWSN